MYKPKENDKNDLNLPLVEHQFLSNNPANPFVSKGTFKLTLFELNLDENTTNMVELMNEVVEFPVVSQDCIGYENRYTYLSLLYDDDHKTLSGNENG